jgi:hypothetical protein
MSNKKEENIKRIQELKRQVAEYESTQGILLSLTRMSISSCEEEDSLDHPQTSSIQLLLGEIKRQILILESRITRKRQ